MINKTGTPLKNKEEIMEYSGLKKKALKEAIDQAGFPAFFLGNKMMSNTSAVDEWTYSMSINGGNIIIDGEDKADE